MSLDSPSIEQQAQPNREHQLRFVVNVLTRHWILILVFALSVSLVYGLFDMLHRRTQASPRDSFQGQAKVIIKQSLWDRDALKGIGGVSTTQLDAQKLVAGYRGSQALAEKIARALVQQDVAEGRQLAEVATENEYKLKTAEIKRNLDLTAENQNNNEITLIVKDCATKQEALNAAEFAARVFVDEVRQMQMETAREAYDAVKKRLEELQRELSKAENEQWDARKNMDAMAYGNPGDQLSKIHQEIMEKQALKEVTATKLAEIEAQLKTNGEQLPESLGTVTDTVVTDLMTELDKLLQKQVSLSVIYTDQYAEVQELKEEIGEKKTAIIEAIKQMDLSMGGGSTVWRQRQELYKQQLDLRVSLTSADIRVAALQRMLDELTPKITKLSNQNFEYERLQKNTDRLREQFSKCYEQEYDMRNAMNRQTGQIERNESVTATPTGILPGGTRWWMSFLIGGLVGFVIGFGLAIMFEIMDTSIRSIEDVATYVGLEVIGTIPRMRFGKAATHRRKGTYVATTDEDQIDACIVTQHDPKSPISEAYRTLRTNFQFATMNIKPRTLMVTSAVPGEGKTTTAVNFAVTMADRGIRVLLVDTDLRRPNVHRVLKIERGPGLADVLREGLDVHSVIRKTRVENLWIISSGRVPPNPSELIGSDRMQRVIRQLGAEFDLVICDAPSVLVVTDPVLISTHVDTTLVVISVNNARRETVQRAQKLLQAANSNIAGVVLNGLEATRRHYYYYYYYYEDGARGQRRWYHF